MGKWESRAHLGEEQLLRYIDGEADLSEMRRVRAHLESCWQCRTELENIQKTIGECVRYRKTVLQEHLPPPPAPWADLSVRFDGIEAARAEQNLLRRAFTAFEPLWTSPRGLVTAAAAVALAVGLVQHFRDTPSVKAAELLRKAVSAAEKRSAPQRLIQFRTRTRRVTHKVPIQRASLAPQDELQPVIEKLERANYDWQDPLSARTFAAWRDQLPDREDALESSSDDNSYRVRTTSETNEVAEATLALRMDDLTPVESRLRFQNDDWVEITEVAEAPVVSEAAPARVSPPAPVSAAVQPQDATAADELQVLASLHRLGADLGEPIDVQRSGPKVVVTSSGLPAERRQEIESVLEKLPRVSVQFTDPPAAAAISVPDQPAVSVSPQRSDLQARLEAFTGGRAHLESLASDVLHETDQMMARGYALRNLAERFPADVAASLSTGQREVLRRLLRVHAEAMTARAEAIRQRMEPSLISLGATPEDAVPNLPEAWQSATAVLFDKARRLEKALGSVLAGAPSESPDELVSDRVLRLILELRVSSQAYNRLVLNP